MADAAGFRRAQTRMIASMRLVLCAAALVIVWIDPAEPVRLAALTYGILAAYTAYSALLYALALRGIEQVLRLRAWWHWGDLGWYALLVAVSGSVDSIFFFGLIFAVLVASFSWGFASGLRVTVVAVLAFTAISLSALETDPDPEWNQFLLRSVALLVLGYLLATWGGFEIRNRRRLGLLRELSSLANPRLGPGRVLAAMLERLRAHYDADGVILVENDTGSGGYCLRRADRNDPDRAAEAIPLPASLARRLLAFPSGAAVRFRADRVRNGSPAFESVAALLEAESFLSVPLRARDTISGRLFVTTIRPRSFDPSELEFLEQVVSQALPSIDHMILLDRLATGAANEERRRIARDIHDGLLQPYIAVQMGLVALSRRLGNGDVDLAADVRNLIALADLGLDGLRGSLQTVRNGRSPDEGLLPAVRRVAEHFAQATGIEVRIDAKELPRIPSRIAAEALEMVLEGLSNVRRHTDATRASVHLARRNGALEVRIENDRGAGTPAAPFVPRSIRERAVALGGMVDVEIAGGRSTVVRIEVPFPAGGGQ